MINWKTTIDEAKQITRIANRAAALAREHGIDYDTKTAYMDIAACHLNGCPLNLDQLENAPEGDFGHDVFGIRRFIDRQTGKIPGAKFDPRCSMPANAPRKKSVDKSLSPFAP